MKSRLLPSERIAIVVLAVLMVPTFFSATLYRAFWFLGPLLLLLWGLALLIAVFHVGFALKDPHDGTAARLRAALAVPASVAVATALHLGVALGPRVEASAYLLSHSAGMDAAQREAGAGQPAALPYLEGVPDGGQAIIRSSEPPNNLPGEEQYRLTAGRITGCDRIIPDAWLCRYG